MNASKTLDTFTKIMEHPVYGNLIAVAVYIVGICMIGALSSHPIGIFILTIVMALSAIGGIFNGLFFFSMPKSARKEFYQAAAWSSTLLCGVFYVIIFGIFLTTSKLNAALMLPFLVLYVVTIYDRLTD